MVGHGGKVSASGQGGGNAGRETRGQEGGRTMAWAREGGARKEWEPSIWPAPHLWTKTTHLNELERGARAQCWARVQASVGDGWVRFQPHVYPSFWGPYAVDLHDLHHLPLWPGALKQTCSCVCMWELPGSRTVSLLSMFFCCPFQGSLSSTGPQCGGCGASREGLAAVAWGLVNGVQNSARVSSFFLLRCPGDSWLSRLAQCLQWFTSYPEASAWRAGLLHNSWWWAINLRLELPLDLPWRMRTEERVVREEGQTAQSSGQFWTGVWPLLLRSGGVMIPRRHLVPSLAFQQ